MSAEQVVLFLGRIHRPNRTVTKVGLIILSEQEEKLQERVLIMVFKTEGLLVLTVNVLLPSLQIKPLLQAHIRNRI